MELVNLGYRISLGVAMKLFRCIVRTDTHAVDIVQRVTMAQTVTRKSISLTSLIEVETKYCLMIVDRIRKKNHVFV